METQPDGNEDPIAAVKDMRQQLEARIESQHKAHMEMLASIQAVIPNLVSSLDLSLKVVSSFNHRPFYPTPVLPLPDPKLNPKKPIELNHRSNSESYADGSTEADLTNPRNQKLKTSIDSNPASQVDSEKVSPLAVVRSLVAVCLLGRVSFSPIDSSTVSRKLENDQAVTPAEKAALQELGGDSGAILAVEIALRSMADDNGGVEVEEFVVSGKARIMVLNIDRTRLLRELPESAQYQRLESSSGDGNVNQNQVQQITNSGTNVNGSLLGMGRPVLRPMSDMWIPHGDPHMSGLQPMFPGAPRGAPRVMGMMGTHRGMSIPSMHRLPMGPNAQGSSPNAMAQKPRTLEDDMKDLEALLNKKSFREMQKSKTGEELLDLIHRPTARETAVAAKFKTKGGSQVRQYCDLLTKEDCRRQSGSFIACDKVHFRRIIAPHTDINLGDCSFLDTCRHMKTCKYVHYEYDPTPDVSPTMMGAPPPPKPLKPQRAEYCSEVELGEPQWINCDIRNFRMDILGQFGVIMADPPWDIHMELPYGTMADDEMRSLNVPALQTDGLIFLWVTGRAMELGRECLELWGYKRVEEIIWVKTNQLQRIIRTGRTGHWLNHSKEHCLVGIKGDPEVNRNIDTDVIVAEVRETSRKPDEMYPMLERISPRTRKLELFARMHNTHAGWMSLGNQLSGVRLVDEGLRARFKAAYPDVEVQPPSPPRASAMEVDTSVAPHTRSPFAATESKSNSTQFGETAPAPETNFASEDKSMVIDVDIA
ncbi:N6-adenosine-methyltransferase MT-A70-like [Vigna unguiculata]|uniref:N6-adenosine-methyltransferase MT-A70-like n=1 Tax=Vigna unguiculata TaxID=3917 RepID=UPI0010161E8A|nr:N6-adenosine-methyltransferase MT-A70-like [Vigna unguiculata]XP_027924490.1 N6-adenosine-methyltransferase MT-A70-like [Vigna unguiculata]